MDEETFYLSLVHTQHLSSPNSQVFAMLQSISMSLSDIQGQLSVMQEQNACRDETLCVLDRDIKELKSMKRFSDDSNDAEERVPED